MEDMLELPHDTVTSERLVILAALEYSPLLDRRITDRLHVNDIGGTGRIGYAVDHNALTEPPYHEDSDEWVKAALHSYNTRSREGRLV